MRKTECLLVAVCLLVRAAYGQSVNANANTVHVFPQAVDGVSPDGSAYVTNIFIDNMGSDVATCTFSGPFASRLGLSPFLVTNRFSPSVPTAVAGTTARESIMAGYVVLTCSQPVLASLTYFSFAPTKNLTGMATVTSARAVSSAFLKTGALGRFGLAIANPSNSTLNLTIQFIASVGGDTVQRIISVAPNTSLVRFTDEMLDPYQGTQSGMFLVSSNTTDKFYITGLWFIGGTFTTIVPGATN